MKHLAEHTIFLTLAGSQAHGTAREGSDVDLRGVCVVPLAERLSLGRTFEQKEGDIPVGLEEKVRQRLAEHPTASRALDVKLEGVIFDIAKFLRLCAAANPNALEILFADEADWVLETPAWRRLHAARHQFLTKKVQQSFQGYAMAQLKKIKSHRSWLLNPPTQKPAREDFGFPAAGGSLSREVRRRIEEAIAEKSRSYGIDDIEMPSTTRIAVQQRLSALYSDLLATSEEGLDEALSDVASRALKLPADVVNALQGEKRYHAAMSHWNAYQAWKTERNPARAALEAKHGYDTKHAMHLIRLMRMGLEVLQTGELRVRRRDAAELSAIRDGALSFDALVAEADALRPQLEAAALTSTLPADVDHTAVDALAFAVMAQV